MDDPVSGGINQDAIAKNLKLPNMNEFSPGVLGNDIQSLLNLIASAAGDAAVATSSISQNYDKIKATVDLVQRSQRAKNVLIGMAQCGLLEKQGKHVTANLTDLAEQILNAPTSTKAADILARHLIENCHGAELFDVTANLRSRGDPLTVENIRDELESRGFSITENEGNSSKIRQWLEAANIVDADWNINEMRLHAVVGSTSAVMSAWHALTRGQRIFLEVLKETAAGHAGGWHVVRKIKKIAETRYGPRAFPTGQLRQKVLDPLESGGWLNTRGKGSGRGGDSGDVQPLPQLIDIAIKLPLEDVAQIPADLRTKLATPLDKIFEDLESPNTGVKGQALELLALNILRDVGLTPVGFRLRSAKTQGAEVDLIAEGANLLFGRWLVQCKNTPRKNLEVDQIAKEVGLAIVMQAHVVMLVTTGKIGRPVKAFADGLARTSSLQAVLIDGATLKTYKNSKGAALIDYLNENARQVLTLKTSQRVVVPE
jgi:hypothetical protein